MDDPQPLPTQITDPISRPSSTSTTASANLQQLPGISALAASDTVQNSLQLRSVLMAQISGGFASSNTKLRPCRPVAGLSKCRQIMAISGTSQATSRADRAVARLPIGILANKSQSNSCAAKSYVHGGNAPIYQRQWKLGKWVFFLSQMSPLHHFRSLVSLQSVSLCHPIYAHARRMILKRCHGSFACHQPYHSALS